VGTDSEAALREEIVHLREQRDQAWNQLALMRRSLSWRVTWPLRQLVRLVRMGRR